MKTLRLSILSLLSAIALLPGVSTTFAAGWPSNYGGVMLQGFWWDSYDNSKWTVLESQAEELANYFDIIWVPNSGQASGSPNMGYLPIYWFTNHNSSFGTEAQLRSMIQTFHSKNVNIIMDLVINHRVGRSDWANFPAETWNGTTYQLDNTCVCRTDEWARNGGNPTGANDEGEDFDGGRDLDHTNSKVQTNVKAYCKFLLEDLGYAGFRLDMVKGYAGYYTKMYNQYAKPRFSVGEYWDGYDNIVNWINSTDKESAAFDFPFKYALNDAMNGDTYNMEKLCWLANGWDPQPAGLIHHDYRRYAVTFIDNHDTYRNNNKFTGNPLAANAMLLCCPGTPCVFLKHWVDYKSEIKKMIAIRKAVGVTNTSTVNVLKHTGDCFMAEVTGTKGKLVVKIGPAMDSPSGYSNSDIKASGTNWCIWTNVSVPAVPGPLDSDPFKVYWDNSSAKWTTPKVHYFGGVSSSDWPGVNMTKVSGTENVYEYTVSAGTTGLVFTNGSGTKTDDCNAVANHLYGLSGDKGAYSGGDTGGGSGGNSGGDTGGDTGDGTEMIIYFDNSNSGWSPVNYYTAPQEKTWPGKTMTYVGGKTYKCTVSKNTTMIIFNNNDKGKQTQDIPLTSSSHNTIFAGSGTASNDKYNATNDGSILPSAIYVLGNLWGDSNDWKPNQGIELTKNDNVYTGQITVHPASGNTHGFISFVQKKGTSSTDWSSCNSKHRYGAKADDTPLAVGASEDIVAYAKSGNPGAASSFKVEPGTYNITVNFNTLKVLLEPTASSLTLSKTTIAMAPGATESLTATIEPEGTGGDVIWTSSNPEVATVSTAGTVTGVAKGEAVITATYGSLSATCNVYVGKTAQSILWTQTIPVIPVGETLNLTATSTSGLSVTYAVTSGADVVEVSADGILTALKAGLASVEARQTGNDTYAPASPVSKTVMVKINYVPGDALGDGEVSVDDVIAIVYHILGKPVMVGEEEVQINTEAANVNGDEVIDVVDVSLVINLIISSAPTQIVENPDGSIEKVIESSAGSIRIDRDGTARLYDRDGNLLIVSQKAEL